MPYAVLLLAPLLHLTAMADEPPAAPPEPPPEAVHPIEVRDLPSELDPWIAWVRTKHPDLGCPLVGGSAACVWPGSLAIDARADGATARMQVTVDREGPVALPGGAGTWPQSVRIDGAQGVVIEVGGVPMALLSVGSHSISAEYPWVSQPQSTPVPPETGRVDLSVNGEPVPWPRIDSDGLRLGAGEVEEREGERLDLEVSRRIRDGVPVVVDTEVTVRAAGSGREVVLGNVLVAGTQPVALSATLPARFTPQRELVVQVRPGTYRISFEAVHDGPVAQLSAPSPGAPWPDTEYWAVATDDRTRAVNLSGPPGIDAARTTLPEAWRTLPTFAVSADTPLQFEELRRGEPHPAPNQLELTRELWLDTDGGGFTVRDAFSGTMHQGWRLNIAPPAVLGHVADLGEDQVITATRTGDVGAELRSLSVDTVAESRIEQRPTTLAAVGWDTDVNRLSAELYLPPGWSLLAGTGIDNLDGSVLAQWTLFDLFFVLVVAMATGRLVGWRWGAVALAGLVLARHETGAPQWTWALLVTLVALGRVVPAGWPNRLVEWSRWACLIALASLLLPFAVQQVQTGLFPALERPWIDPPVFEEDYEQVPDRFAKAVVQEAMAPVTRSAPSSDDAVNYKGKDYLSAQVDPGAVVQTGPGVPTWTWNRQPLSWSGPVSRDHQMRLLLLGPGVNLVLALLRVSLLVALGLVLAQLGNWRSWGRATAGIAVLLALFGAPPAHASPDPALLDELERRLTAPPSCAPSCATVPFASVRVRDDRLTVEAQVHAAVATSWPIPGPTNAWVPAEVRLDGATTSALARRADGFLHVRIPRGAHRVRVEGPLPPADAVTLQWGLPPQRAEWSGEGWSLDGLRADGTVERSVQLARMLAGTTGTEAQSTENLAPWLEVHRQLDLGIPWRVRTTVLRVGPTDHPVAIRVPHLPGEAVTDSAFEAADGLVHVTLDRDQKEVSWLSTLQEADTIALTAPADVPWSEQWTLSCSPVFACSADGPAPLRHVVDGTWSPLWRAWPGETVTLSVYRPEAVAGQTVTIEATTLTVRPGRRQLVGDLQLTVRSSQGGRQVLGLPPGALLQEVRIDGQDKPIQPRDDNAVHVPLRPGKQQIALSWQQPHPPAFWDRVPAVDLGGPAVNTKVIVEPMAERWIVALLGPRWGPTPLFWTFVILVAAAAPLLARLPWAPLTTRQWLLLGLGMTQVPVFAPIAVVLWFMALGWRERRSPESWWAFDVVQLALVLGTVIAMGCLYAAIHAGLLLQPDMQVAGNGSYDQHLEWFVDRTEGPLPQPVVASLPMWSWRVLMLVWSLWLAASLVRWLPWAWRAFSSDGLVRLPPKPEPKSKRQPPAPPETPSQTPPKAAPKADD